MYDFIPKIMKDAAKLMLSAHDIDAGVTVKPGDANFVTAYDVAVEDYLCRELSKQMPDAVIIGEEAEENHTELLRTSLALIIDPIDGTTNFIHNRRYSAISVGVCDHGTMTYGAVYHPYEDRLYHAEKDHGAFVLTADGRDTPIHTADHTLAQSLSCFGTSPYYKEELGEKTFRAAFEIFKHTRDIRRSGSAALDLAEIAAGSIDLFLEYRLSPWDYAAGSLLITEAGGKITQTDGSPITFDHPCSILAGNPKAHGEMLGLQIL